MTQALVFNLQRYSLEDGPGIRTTVFLKGCALRCWWCHNPESLSPEPELAYSESRCTHCGECRQVCPRQSTPADRPSKDQTAECIRCGACVAACSSRAREMIGQWMTVDEVMKEILKDRIFYEDSGGGVTFSGGEPLLQDQYLQEALEACRDRGVHTALDTCGYAPQERLLAIAALCDLVLYDLKVIDDQRHRQFTGVSNALILDNLASLGRVHDNIWVRVPIIPGYNDDAEQLEATARLAASVPGVRQVNLLPYHRTGIHKWTSLGRPRSFPPVAPLAPDSLEQAAARFRAFGLKTHIGG